MSSINLYIHMVKFHLKCNHEIKTELMNSLNFYITDSVYDEDINLNLHELFMRFGTPKEVALRYMDEVSEYDYQKYKTKIRIYKILSAFFVLSILIVGYIAIIHVEPIHVNHCSRLILLIG